MTRPIVCAVDLKQALPCHAKWATRVADAVSAPLLLTHVLESHPAPALYAPGAIGAVPTPGVPLPLPEADEVHEQHIRDAELELASLATELGRTRMRPRVLTGPVVATALRELAAEVHAQLLIVASSGHGAARAVLLGSTSHSLATRAPCPVAIVSEEAHALAL